MFHSAASISQSCLFSCLAPYQEQLLETVFSYPQFSGFLKFDSATVVVNFTISQPEMSFNSILSSQLTGGEKYHLPTIEEDNTFVRVVDNILVLSYDQK